MCSSSQAMNRQKRDPINRHRTRTMRGRLLCRFVHNAFHRLYVTPLLNREGGRGGWWRIASHVLFLPKFKRDDASKTIHWPAYHCRKHQQHQQHQQQQHQVALAAATL